MDSISFSSFWTVLGRMCLLFGGIYLLHAVLGRFGNYLEKRKKNSGQTNSNAFRDVHQSVVNFEKVLKASGFRLAVNQHCSITAVVSYYDYERALQSALAVEASEENSKAWSRLRLMIKRTYTFAENFDDQRPAHTGTMKDLNSMLRVLFGRILNRSMDKYSEKDIEYLFRVISVRDKRIHVPFTSDKEVEGRRDLRTFGRNSLVDFLAEVVETVPPPSV